jgi:hypothetical protein
MIEQIHYDRMQAHQDFLEAFTRKVITRSTCANEVRVERTEQAEVAADDRGHLPLFGKRLATHENAKIEVSADSLRRGRKCDRRQERRSKPADPAEHQFEEIRKLNSR